MMMGGRGETARFNLFVVKDPRTKKKKTIWQTGHSEFSPPSAPWRRKVIGVRHGVIPQPTTPSPRRKTKIREKVTPPARYPEQRHAYTSKKYYRK